MKYSTFKISNGLTYEHQLSGMAKKLSMNKLQCRKNEARIFPTVISFSVLGWSSLSLLKSPRPCDPIGKGSALYSAMLPQQVSLKAN